jgi:hypothetical protein
MVLFVVLGLATTAGFASADQETSKAPSAKKTYPISRFLTSRLNPTTGFGIKRFIGARGLLGRLKAGQVTGNDRRSIRRILTGQGLSKSEADTRSRTIIEQSRNGELAGGRKYRISRFFTSRKWQGIVSGVSTTLNFLTFGLAAAVTTGVKAGLVAAGGAHLDRVIFSRALAGRIAMGKPLIVSEHRLLERLAIAKQPAQPIEPTADRVQADPVVAEPTPVAATPDIVMAADGYPGAVTQPKPSFFKRLFSGGPLTPADAVPK